MTSHPSIFSSTSNSNRIIILSYFGPGMRTKSQSSGPSTTQIAPTPNSEIAEQASAPNGELTVFNNLAQLKVMVSRIAMHFSDSQRAKIFSNLDRLLDLDSWSDDDSLISDSSFRTFLRFMIYYGNVRDPSLTVSVGGNVAASWFIGENRFTVEFFPYDKVRCVSYERLGAGGEPELLTFVGRLEGIRHAFTKETVKECWLSGSKRT